MRDPRAVEPLIKALGDGSGHVRRAAAEALGKYEDDRVIAPLLRMLGSGDGDERAAAARALKRHGDPRAVGPLLAALRLGSGAVRVDVAGALAAHVGDRRVAPVLDEALEREDLEVIAGAYDYYLRRRTQRVDDLLIRALEQHGTESMARALLSGKGEQLGEAARTWASRNGYAAWEVPTPKLRFEQPFERPSRRR